MIKPLTADERQGDDRPGAATTMTLWARLRAFFRGDEQAGPARLAQLAAEARTVELCDLEPADRVIRLALGGGQELWRVHPGYCVRPRRGLVDGGELVVDRGQPVTDASRLAFLEHRIEHLAYAE